MDRSRSIALYALLAGLFIGSMEFTQTQGLLSAWNEQPLWWARLVVHWTIACLPMGVAASALFASGREASRAQYAVAVVASAVSGSALLALHGRFVDPALGRWAVGFDMELWDRFLYGAWVLGFWGSIAATLHAADARQRGFATALRGAELVRVAKQQRLAEATLAAFRARYEPDHLLSALKRIEQAYGTDRLLADRLLDELIHDSRSLANRLREGRSA